MVMAISASKLSPLARTAVTSTRLPNIEPSPDVQVAVDAVLLAGAGGGRKEHVRGLGAQHLLPRMAERLLRRLVELGDDALGGRS